MNDMPLVAMDGLIYNAPDSLLRMTLMGGEARVMMCRTTRMAQTAADTHLASDVAAAAMGRVLPATAMLSTMMKEENSAVTLTFAGDGVGGKITCVGRQGDLKISVDNPQAEVPPLSDGRLDVPGFVGSTGRLTVIKDFGQGDPYVGTSQLVSGGVAEDMTQYYTVSEQTPSLVALGCLNQDGVVLSSGGILIQAMPGCSEETLHMLEMRIPFYSNISREIYDRSMEELCRLWFRDMDVKILSSTPLSYKCDCSQEKMEAALIATGKQALHEMLDDNKDVEMVCWFCRTRRHFTPKEIERLLDKATQP